jgi:hypothetical protein
VKGDSALHVASLHNGTVDLTTYHVGDLVAFTGLCDGEFGPECT